VRARVLLCEEGGFRYGCELDATNAEEVWRETQRDPRLAGRSLREGDVVYVGDVYLALDGDGGWRKLELGLLTEELYGVIVREEAN
jgi:hypothetical protein